MMARVAGVSAASSPAGSRVQVAGSTSTATGLAPTWETAIHDAMKVCDGTITSCPAPTPAARSARDSASSPLLTVTACSTPQ